MFRLVLRVAAPSALVVSTLAPFAFVCHAQQSDSVRSVPVVVTGTRTEQRSLDLPMSIDLVDKARISEGQMGVNASEALQIVPGVVANNRNNYAQDLQISIRGFGARSTFGVRGLRLYADGIPLTMPDGQGQAANIDLGTARSIEVLRGPFSSLYGNSSGGVISVFTENGPDGLVITPNFGAGSFDTTKAGIKVGGTSGNVNYLINSTRFDSNGYRDYSAVTRDTVNAKLLITPDELTRITLVANYLMQPDTQDPLGLTRAQYETDPRQVGTVGTLTARDYGVRKSIDNTQIGLVYERQVGQDLFRALVYAGDRQVQQYLGLTFGAQAAATSGGGVVDLDRQFRGLDVRYTHRNQLASVPFTLTFGLNADEQYERRKGWNNFVGTTVGPTLGVQGALRRDEGNRVYNVDQYIQGEFSFTERLLVSAGLRNSQVNFKSSDYFIKADNPDDSGALKFSALTPVAGLLYRISPLLHAYASYGKGFETPTFAELAYRTTGAGINTDLKPNRTENVEMGVKALVLDDTRLNAALFQSRGDNEITVLSNTGGRSIFQNSGPTTRRGVELMLDSRFSGGFYGLAAATYLEATFDKDFTTCAVASCAVPNVRVAAGNKIPGVPAFTIYGELGWRNPGRGLAIAMEARGASKVYVNDRNSEFATSYELMAVRASWSQEFGRVRFTEFVRVDNVFDRRYVGSVIVNETSGRFYEPGAGRSVFAGVSAAISF